MAWPVPRILADLAPRVATPQIVAVGLNDHTISVPAASLAPLGQPRAERADPPGAFRMSPPSALPGKLGYDGLI